MRDPLIEYNRQLSIKAWAEQGKRALNESFKNTPLGVAGSSVGSGGAAVGSEPEPPVPVPVSATLSLTVDATTYPYTFGFEITASAERGLTVVVNWDGSDITTTQVAAGEIKQVIGYNYTSADIFTPVIEFSDVSAVEGLFFDWPVNNGGSGRINDILNSELMELKALTELSFTENRIPLLDLSHLGSPLQTVSVVSDDTLETFIIENSNIGELVLTNCNSLISFTGTGSEFTENLVISGNKDLSNLDISDIKILYGLDISQNTALTAFNPPSASSLAGEGIIITTRDSPIAQTRVDKLLSVIYNSDILIGRGDLVGSDAPSAAGLQTINLLTRSPRNWRIDYTA
jgi:hypothetical protein